MNSIRRGGGERGSALIVGLIMLLLITLFALSSFSMGKSSMEIAGNAQQTDAMVNSANDALQEAVSTDRMYRNRTAVFLKPCDVANTRCFDLNNDGTDDVRVELNPAPICVEGQLIPSSALNLSNADDQKCVVGAQQTFGIIGSTSNASLCANSIWDLNATATDKVTLATATVDEGVSVRVSKDILATVCP